MTMAGQFVAGTGRQAAKERHLTHLVTHFYCGTEVCSPHMYSTGSISSDKSNSKHRDSVEYYTVHVHVRNVLVLVRVL